MTTEVVSDETPAVVDPVTVFLKEEVQKKSVLLAIARTVIPSKRAKAMADELKHFVLFWDKSLMPVEWRCGVIDEVSHDCKFVRISRRLTSKTKDIAEESKEEDHASEESEKVFVSGWIALDSPLIRTFVDLNDESEMQKRKSLKKKQPLLFFNRNTLQWEVTLIVNRERDFLELINEDTQQKYVVNEQSLLIQIRDR